jgi:hypothetical protein
MANNKVMVRERQNCEVCRAEGQQTPALYDARIPGSGQWGNLCQVHFDGLGCRLGLGMGQALVKDTRNRLPVQEKIRLEDLVEPLKEHAIGGQHHEALQGAIVVDVFMVELTPVEVMVLAALNNLEW